MNWKKLLASPPPSSAWVLSEERVFLAVRARKTGLRGGSRPVAAGTFEVGPVGLQGLDRAALTPVLEAVNAEVGGGRRPAVAVPTAWARFQLLEFQGLPKRTDEARDVVRWRLKKLLPVPPADLRFDLLRFPGEGGAERVLVAMILERAAGELEAAFEEAGMVPGVLVPRLFLLGAGGAGWRMVVELAEGLLALLVLHDGLSRMERSRTIPAGRSAVDVAGAELRLLAVHLRENLGVPDTVTVPVQVCSDDAGVRDAVGGLVAGTPGFGIEAAEPLPKIPGIDGGDATRRAIAGLLGEEG